MYRNRKLDLLRVISMIMVIIIYIANYYCRLYSNISKVSYLRTLIFNTISRISVLTFLYNWLDSICNSFKDDRYSNGFTKANNNTIDKIVDRAYGYKRFNFLD